MAFIFVAVCADGPFEPVHVAPYELLAAFAAQPLLQLADARLQRAELRVLRVLVHRRRVAHALRALRVAQRGQRLLVAAARRRDGGDHERLGVAAERVLEDVGQFRSSIRNVRVSIHQRLNYQPQIAQAQVDLRALAQPLAARAGAVDALRAREVHEVHLAAHHAAAGLAALRVQHEDGVGARGARVRGGGGGGARAEAAVEEL